MIPAFWQIDHKVESAKGREGVVVLPSPEAYRKFPWTRGYFGKRPKEGYFVWVREKIDFPLTTCVTIASPQISQDLNNLLVIERGIKAEASVVCNAAKTSLCATHKARGKLLLKEGACLEYRHFHRWGREDFVSPDYSFILEEGARLSYTYKNLFPPKRLGFKTTITAHKNASCNLDIIINGQNSETEIKDTVRLKGEDSRGVVRLRLVGKKRARIRAVSRMVAEAAGKGHLDCQGLLVDEGAKITLVPEVDCRSKEAQITHEASIGKVSEEALNYLRSRGLTENEAIDLIVTGFLGEEEPVSVG